MSLLQMSTMAGVLVVFLVLIRAVALNRVPKTMFLLLWGTALFRLLTPFSISLPFGFAGRRLLQTARQLR